MSDKTLLTVILLNYETPEYITNCLDTLLPQLALIDSKVVVVDNNSSDGSCEIIENWINRNDVNDDVNLIRSNRNDGFASGNNIGVKQHNSEYYLLLNSDTLIRPGAIESITSTATENPEAGLVSPRLEWPDGAGQESCFRFHNPMAEFCRSTQTGIFDRMFSNFLVPLPVQESLMRPQWTSFACVLIKNKVFESIGMLDEGYFMYFEDVEFCYRASQAGWQIVHNPEARVVHLRGGSSPVKDKVRQKKQLPRYFYESRTRYFYQTQGRLSLTMANICWTAGRSISGLRQILGRPDKAAIRGQWKDIWSNWLRPLKPYTHPGTPD